MKNYRIQPYAQFNFLVDLGTGVGNGPHGGFQEFSGVQKLTGLNKSTDVTFKRGIIAAPELQNWLDQIRHGRKQAKRTVTIMMQNEDHKIVQKWKLLRARIIKHVSGPLNAKGTDVAMEELVIAYERLELE
jgi:phage tail-like protein